MIIGILIATNIATALFTALVLRAWLSEHERANYWTRAAHEVAEELAEAARMLERVARDKRRAEAN